MPTFAHPALLWGLLIVGVPVLIHLINMLRHRRVPWAAMEFLRVSQRRYRTWNLLKQLLLLLMRMAAVAAIVLMLAQPRLPAQWGGLLDGRVVHHIVLLDDSYSMSEVQGGMTAFERAKAAAERIGAEAARQPRPQAYTLIRFSEAAKGTDGKPDLLAESIAGDFMSRLRDRLEKTLPSQRPDGPMPALDALESWLGSDTRQQRVVYLLTDFRTRHWAEPGELRGELERLSRSRTALNLVQCAEREQVNIAITSLKAAEGIRAAGVPFFVDLEVANHSDAGLKDVLVFLEADDVSRPAVRIPQVPARQAVVERVTMQFASAGEHLIAAKLDSDALPIDDRRDRVVTVPADLPVLLIDGDVEAPDARYLSAALSPGGAVATGLTPRIERPRYLSQNPLTPFRSIYLLNVERLEDSAVDALENYVANGGGLGVFLGPRCSPAFYNERLYRNGEGVFPAPLSGQETLFVDRLEKTPDINPGNHPIFRVFSGKSSSFLSAVSVQQYYALPRPLPDAVDPSVNVVARLRNGAPLVLESEFGKGRVVTFLTTAGPEWNNWARGNPSYVVTMLELQAFLSRPNLPTEETLVGDNLTVSFDAAAFNPQVQWLPPVETGLEPTTIEGVLGEDGRFRSEYPAATSAGIYRAALTSKDGAESQRVMAVNVDPIEGNLDRMDGPALAAALDGVDYRYEPVSVFRYSEEEFAGTDLTDTILFLLLGLLLAEQFFAYWVGDHPPRTENMGEAA